MRNLEQDDQGNVHVGPYARRSTAKVTVDFDSADTDGVALDVEATPAAGNERAMVRLGDFLIGQDFAKTGFKSFTITDINGVVLFTVSENSSYDAYISYLDAVTDATFWHQGSGTIAAFLTEDQSSILPALAGGATDAAIWARANLLQSALGAHLIEVGSRFVLGAHLVEDTAIAATLAAVPVATTTGTTCTLAIALGAALVAHGDSSGVHFHNDTTASGTGYTPTSDLTGGNATKAKAIIELNALLVACYDHIQASSS